jgi:D-glycero-D-manno-heptose 1,7-bisphosphate phosphatase
VTRYIFLDRDGVINRDSEQYIKRWAEFSFLPGSLEAIRRITEHGFRVIVITNQSIVGRGWVDASVLDDIFRRMRAAVTDAGGCIHDIFHCPHTPDDDCDCRKPKPGLILQAQARYGIRLVETVMVGDSAKDILCGREAGCGATVLVRTGNIDRALNELSTARVRPDQVVADLAAAVDWILSPNGPGRRPERKIP